MPAIPDLHAPTVTAISPDADNPIPGFHLLSDCDTRQDVIAMYDGTSWWMPGSDLAFPDDMVARQDGTNSSGRFHHMRHIDVPRHAYGAWEVESGRFH